VGFASVGFILGVIAYNLFIGFKRLFCKEAWRQTIATFRWKMIQVAGRIVRHAERVILRLAADAKTLLHFEEIRRNCFVFAWETG
jgi:hypothetical protein